MRNLALAALLLATAASPALAQKVAPILTTPEARDVLTNARPAEARVTHVDLDLDVDFDSRTIGGTATLNVLAAKGAKEIVLDAVDLKIAAITDEKGNKLPHAIGPNGSALTIQLNGAKKIRIDYRSGPNASALQWLTPEQTLGKAKPFLFSQGQAINNRSWIPTQDSPGIRQTWRATVRVPEGLIAVMSARAETPAGIPVAGGKRAFRFVMDNPVPPYLIAIAAGDLKFKPIGPRSGVWSEPGMLDAAVAEFGDVEKMIDAAQALYGPYRWGRYDMLVLPPSFPYGGMENPNLTFLTPTLLTGDRSNTDVVAHELAHSWSGNLVTNATWADGWLNEGFTTYFENRIMESLYGKERAAIYSDLDYAGMVRDVKNAGGETAKSTRLHGDPGDGAGQLDYLKGSAFLRTIEYTVGRAKWDVYLKGYFDRYAFQPQTSAGFLADLRKQLIKGDKALEAKLQLDRWVFEPGIPSNAVHVKSATLAQVDAMLAAFNAGGPASAIKTEGWQTQQWKRLLDGLPRQQSAARLRELDDALGLTRSTNAYIQSAWFDLAIANRYDPIVPALEEYLTRVGRNLLVTPLYRGLKAQGDWGMPIAQRIFDKAKPGYHPVTVVAVTRILG
ncbi:aminopeptidase [Sphingomonas koreensis]|uniref:M1 family metallopeptidase n=1 Tax=Sphingomonas koreensis TaxID=93064 RepID=UPI000837917A|nr:M1 family metallopeptidase [Sphingomonas koreensis]PJI87500.1 aminopeptidase N [Sphingomonas koreensis]RSU62885.1 aminopeptidase [Sphingomonas koreensis]RSU71595.1 aminopeptidase [Sphingomonas koreensis]